MENQAEETKSGGAAYAPSTVFNRISFHPVVYALFALIIIFFLYQIVGGGISFILFGIDFSEDNVSAIRWVTLSGQLLFLLVPTLILIRLQSGSIRGFVRFKPIGLAETLVIIVGVLAAQQFLQGYLIIQDSIPLPEVLRPYIESMKEAIERTYRILVSADSIPELLFVIIVIALVPSVSEEILFRGLIQRNFEFSFGLAGGGVVAGVIFGLYHLNPFSMIPLIALGVIFGLLVYKTGSILSAMLAHFVNNFSAVIAVYLRREDYLVIPEGTALTPSLFIVMIVSFLIAVGCWFLLDRIRLYRQTRTELVRLEIP